MKTCTKCSIEKDESEFYSAGFHNGKRYPRGDCKECNRADANARMGHGDPRHARAVAVYGITAAQYAEMLWSQGGVCAICKQPCPTGKRLSVDHDHETRAVRGLLCSNCNNGLGRFKDNPELLEQAASYLRSPPTCASLPQSH